MHAANGNLIQFLCFMKFMNMKS